MSHATTFKHYSQNGQKKISLYLIGNDRLSSSRILLMNISMETYDEVQLGTDRSTVHLYVRQLAIYHRRYIRIMDFLILSLYPHGYVGNKVQEVYVSLTYHQHDH